MKNKYCWLVMLFAFLFIGATTVRAQQKQPPKPKNPVVRPAPAPPPPPTTTRSADITSTDFGDKKTTDSAKFKGETTDNKVRNPRKYNRRCRKYISKRTGKTYRRCRNVSAT